MNDNPPEANTTEREIVAKRLELGFGIPDEERLEAVRALMMNGFGPILEACLDNLPLPAQREAFLQEAAHFLVYYLAVQLNDDREQRPEFKQLMQCFRVLHRTMERTIIERFMQLQTAYRQEGAA